MNKTKVLYIQPMGCEGPGSVDETLSDDVARMVVRPAIGQPIPDAPTPFAAIVILGGPMAVYESHKHPWIEDAVELGRRALESDIPVLGICLGSQILASAAGAGVAPMGSHEIGWAPISLTEEGKRDPVTGGLPATIPAFHFHGDRWDLPEGALLLAGSEKCPNQVFRIAACGYGFQCHLEISSEIPRIWFAAYRDDLARMPDAPSLAEVEIQTSRLAQEMERHARGLFRAFWSQALGPESIRGGRHSYPDGGGRIGFNSFTE